MYYVVLNWQESFYHLCTETEWVVFVQLFTSLPVPTWSLKFNQAHNSWLFMKFFDIIFIHWRFRYYNLKCSAAVFCMSLSQWLLFTGLLISVWAMMALAILFIVIVITLYLYTLCQHVNTYQWKNSTKLVAGCSLTASK